MPTRIVRWLIVSHRYLGITLSALFVVWFASGIAMIHVRGMPSVAWSSCAVVDSR